MVQASAMGITVERGSTGGAGLSFSLTFFDFRKLKILRKGAKLRAKIMLARIKEAGSAVVWGSQGRWEQ
jgi:hypothetical protein